MARQRRASGVTLIEAMIAMSVLVIGSMGLVGLHRIGARMNADSRIMTRATAIAQDLVNQMQLWDYVNDPRLANRTSSNDADFADGAGAFETSSFTADHQESELESQAAPYTWLGVSSASLRPFGSNFQRYWNVAEVDTDDTGAVVAKRVAVIVRWDQNGAARRIVLVTVLRNPSS
jgi:Tfp pilus assembly protein PilV